MRRAHTHLSAALTAALKAQGVELPTVTLEKPRDPAHGDIATNAALVHAKALKVAPRALAEKLLAELELDPSLLTCEGVAGPGFINFRFASAYLQSLVGQALERSEEFGRSDLLAGKRILIEFVSANPTGPLNVVSARAAAVGDALCRIYRELGAECDGEFYVNDAGNQVDLLGRSVLAQYETLRGNVTEIPEGGYHGEYLNSFARSVLDSSGDVYHDMPEDEAAAALGKLAIEHHIAMHRHSLEAFRVQMSSWFHESALRDKRAEWKALEELERRGAIFEKDGAKFVLTSEFGDTQDWVVVTSQGKPTYFLPDIAYHLDKFHRGYDLILDILGPDHHSYITKMTAAMSALGEDAKRLEIMLLQHITLLRDGEPVKMSKRAGQIIEMDELLEEVGVDAARYFFLLRRTSTPLDFDIELAKRQSDDNPVFYAQYAHARIASIFRRAELEPPTSASHLDLLTHDEELTLLRRLRELNDVLADCADSRDPHALTVWLREVAAQFHRFYHHCRVLTTPAELQTARLCLCRATQIALKRGLALCGVHAPMEM
ncbi:MAG: arginine--tRNA ligase [Calditrichaeota bacterium]|nr:arginine--tRNA ligase [Calditrichota bacterium]MCB9366363.1 arginine--tRNA ligase [Calditrichota bacterium]